MKYKLPLLFLSIIFLSGCGIKESLRQSQSNAESYYAEKNAKESARKAKEDAENVEEAAIAEEEAIMSNKKLFNVNVEEYVALAQKLSDVTVDEIIENDRPQYIITQPQNNLIENIVYDETTKKIEVYEVMIDHASQKKRDADITNWQFGLATIGNFLMDASITDRPLYLIADIPIEAGYIDITDTIHLGIFNTDVQDQYAITVLWK